MLNAIRRLGLRTLGALEDLGRLAAFGGGLLRAMLARPARPGRVIQEVFD